MAFKDPLIQALLRGESYTYTLPDGGDFHSMRLAFSYGQKVTISPVTDPGEIQAGDIVFIRWRGGGYITHPVRTVRGDQLLIINSMGKENGWAPARDVLGKVTRIENPPIPRPPVPEMLTQFDETCRQICDHAAPDLPPVLHGIAADFGWYSAQVGEARWEILPNDRAWSFASHLWHILKHAQAATSDPQPERILQFIHHARWHIGMLAGDLLPPED
jgi:hypothetical protein